MHTQTDLKPGDWIKVREEYDIPAILRNGRPTTGRVEDVFDDPTPEAGPPYVGVLVPVDGADVDEHSQYVPYPLDALERLSNE